MTKHHAIRLNHVDSLYLSRWNFTGYHLPWHGCSSALTCQKPWQKMGGIVGKLQVELIRAFMASAQALDLAVSSRTLRWSTGTTTIPQTFQCYCHLLPKFGKAVCQLNFSWLRLCSTEFVLEPQIQDEKAEAEWYTAFRCIKHDLTYTHWRTALYGIHVSYIY